MDASCEAGGKRKKIVEQIWPLFQNGILTEAQFCEMLKPVFPSGSEEQLSTLLSENTKLAVVGVARVIVGVFGSEEAFRMYRSESHDFDVCCDCYDRNLYVGHVEFNGLCQIKDQLRPLILRMLNKCL